MGYSFIQGATKKTVIQELTARQSENARVLESAVTGQYLWMLIEVNGVKSIELAILSKDGSYYGYKLIGEACGPYHYGCPAKLIEKADPPENESAAEWRKANAATLERNVIASARKVGDLIKYGPFEYRLTIALARGGFIVERTTDGAHFKMSAAKFKDATFL